MFRFLDQLLCAVIPGAKECPVCGRAFARRGKFSLPRTLNNSLTVSICDDDPCQEHAKAKQLANWQKCKDMKVCFYYDTSPKDLLGDGVDPYFLREAT